MQLTTDLAQPIVERAMAIVQRNINIMDAGGYIVGSGDPGRVGQYHQGAAAVLRTGRRVEIYPEDLAQWNGVRAGVNLPLRLNERIVGVMGITGAPDEVRPFGELIREMVQLMLVQVRSAEHERTAALVREVCLREVLTGTGEVPERVAREAQMIGLDESSVYRVLLCEPPKAPEPGNYAWVEALAGRAEAAARAAGIETLLVTGPWESRLVLVSSDTAIGLAAHLYQVQGAEAAVAVGAAGQGLAGLRRSYNSALLALQAGRRLSGAGVFDAEQLSLETLLATVAPDEALAFRVQTVGGLPPPGSRQGAQARETIEAFARSAQSLTAAADKLQIHRHTLTYRLDQIQGATGLDPRTWDGLLRLHLGLLMEQILGQNGQNRA